MNLTDEYRKSIVEALDKEAERLNHIGDNMDITIDHRLKIIELRLEILMYLGKILEE